jgi:hypothetical protein
MRPARLLLVLGLMLALAGALASLAGADSKRVVASASGGSVWDIENMFGLELIEVQPFAFTARVYEDGSVDGRYTFRTVDDGVPFVARGPLTCVVISGDRGWFGGLIESSSDASLVGLDMWFQVADNGEGAGTAPDMSTLIGAGGPGAAQEYCDDAPDPRFPWLVEEGNIQIRSG